MKYLFFLTLFIVLGCSESNDICRGAMPIRHNIPRDPIIETKFWGATLLGPERYSGINKAVEDNNRSLFLSYINLRPDYVNAQEDYYRNTPLHVAILWYHYELTELIISLKPDVNIKNKDGNTPLLLIAASGCGFEQYSCEEIDDMVKSMKINNIAKELIANGANPCIKNNDGNTILHAAAGCGNYDLVKYFIGLGLNIKERNNSGQTPIDMARNLEPCRMKDKDKIITILKSGDDH